MKDTFGNEFGEPGDVFLYRRSDDSLGIYHIFTSKTNTLMATVLRDDSENHGLTDVTYDTRFNFPEAFDLTGGRLVIKINKDPIDVELDESVLTYI